MVSTGRRKNRLRAGVDRQAPQQPIKTLFANTNSTPAWLSDANIDAFMASVDAPEAVLV